MSDRNGVGTKVAFDLGRSPVTCLRDRGRRNNARISLIVSNKGGVRVRIDFTWDVINNLRNGERSSKTTVSIVRRVHTALCRYAGFAFA